MKSASHVAWILLILAILGELLGTVSLKYANGSGRPLAWLGVVAGYGSALWLLNLVIAQLDVGVVYALWSGVGIAVIALAGVVWFHEPMTLMRGLGLLAIVLGIVLIQLDPSGAP